MKNENFKNLILNKSFNFSLQLIKFVGSFANDNILRIIKDQLLRAGFSIGANIAEAQGSSSKADFKNFIHHAYKSSIETRYWLALTEKSNLSVNKIILNDLIIRVKELSKILTSIVLTLKGKKTINSS
ncbi:four helix bundle protein [Patescibacteria group bacterium]|nr:four helix bundle protein [Patescibacteria group bacterium]